MMHANVLHQRDVASQLNTSRFERNGTDLQPTSLLLDIASAARTSWPQSVAKSCL